MSIKPHTMLLMMLAGWLNRQQQEAMNYIMEENKILKHELLKATGKKRIILNNAQRRRLGILAKRVGRKMLFDISGIFSPDTLLKWFRQLAGSKYDGSKNHSKFGRPRITDYLKQLIIDMALDNKHLGCRQLHGYMKYLGYKVSAPTIRRVLRAHGIEPAPDRPIKTTWNEFIKEQWGSLVAVDFFNIEVLTFKGIVRYMVLFAIDYKTRRVEILGITPQAYGDWMKQIARNLTDPMNGFCKGKKFIIMDRDPLFTQEFRDILDSCGVSPVRTTAASPNLNPFAERWVRSIKSECLNKIIIFGERHLRYCIEQYVEHYHTSRPHAGLNHDMIDPVPLGKGKIIRHEKLGGLLKSWRREAA